MIPIPRDPVEERWLCRMVLEFVAEHPGCTREEIEAHVRANGGTVFDSKSQFFN